MKPVSRRGSDKSRVTVDIPHWRDGKLLAVTAEPDDQSDDDEDDRRKHHRFEIVTQISMRAGGEVSVLVATNISAGGMFIELLPGEIPGLSPGAEVSVHLDLGSDKYGRPLDLDCRAEVVRVDLGGPGRNAGFAMMWTSHDSAVAKRLAVILEFLHG
jgi:hypothetical protein